MVHCRSMPLHLPLNLTYICRKPPIFLSSTCSPLLGPTWSRAGQRGKGASAEHAVAGTLLAFTRCGIALFHAAVVMVTSGAPPGAGSDLDGGWCSKGCKASCTQQPGLPLTTRYTQQPIYICLDSLSPPSHALYTTTAHLPVQSTAALLRARVRPFVLTLALSHPHPAVIASACPSSIHPSASSTPGRPRARSSAPSVSKVPGSNKNHHPHQGTILMIL